MDESSTDPHRIASASDPEITAEPAATDPAVDRNDIQTATGDEVSPASDPDAGQPGRGSLFAPSGVLGSTPAKVIAGVVVVALILTVVGVVASLSGSEDTPAAKRESSRGFTTTVTVPVYPAGAAVAAQPRPSQLPPLIQAEGDCKVQLDILRDLFDRVPSGLMPLSKADQKILNEQLTKIGPPGPGQSAACSTETAQLFRQQELGPWLVWQPPAATAPAPAPAPASPAPAPAKASPPASPKTSPSASVKR